MEVLLKRGADYSIASTLERWTPLHYACARGAAACVELLLGMTFEQSWRDSAGRIALHHCAANGHLRCVELLLASEEQWVQENATSDGELKPLFVDTADAVGYTALFYAVDNRRVECVRLLLKHGASMEARDTFGLTPLGIAEDVEVKAILSAH